LALEFNSTELNEIVNDFNLFKDLYLESTYNERMIIFEKIQESIYNATSKIFFKSGILYI
jgi:hypothetical protein